MRTAFRARGFTLIELLVVVAIIALLIAILLPSMARAKAQAKQVYCLANVKSMGEAALLYGQANKDVLVQGDDRNPAGQTNSHFVPSLLPGLGYPENVNRLFRRTAGTTFTQELYRVCREVEILNCPEFPQERQVLDYVVNAFAVPYAGTLGIGSPPGQPQNAPANANPSFYFRYGKAGRLDLSKAIYLTEAHAEMPLPPPNADTIAWAPDEVWGPLIDLFIPNHIPFGRDPRVANDQRHPRGITATMFDGHGEVLPLNRVDPGPPNHGRDRIRRFTYAQNDPF